MTRDLHYTTDDEGTPTQSQLKDECRSVKKLGLGNFTREGLVGSYGHRFYSKLEDGREVDLESCMNGYCVAVYDENLDLIGDKVCTNIDGMMEMEIMPGFSIGTGEALEKAVNIANKLIRDRVKDLSQLPTPDKDHD